MDARILEHAEILATYCLEAQPGDTVVIETGPGGLDLADAVVGELGRQGAHPMVLVNSGEASRLWYKHVPDGQVETVPEHQKALYEAADAFLFIKAPTNTRSTADIPADRSQRRSKALRPLTDIRLEKRWTLTMHPTNALAQEADMSLDEFADLLYGAMLIDWVEFGKELDRVKERVDGADTIRVVNEGTDITLPVRDRVWVSSKGQRNMPSGEVFTAPIETEVEGHVTFDIPVVVRGRIVKDVRLVFEKGEVVDWSAGTGEDVVEELLGTDDGARRLGELGIGCNRGIPKPTKNILLDEKLGGTVHLALGAAYKKNKGVNESAIHVDLITTMGPGSYLEADGERFQEDGRFWYEVQN